MKGRAVLSGVIVTLLLAPTAWSHALVTNENRHPAKLAPEPFERGLLPGEFEIEFASARPAPRTYYLVYAAALDQYASEKEKLLADEPVLGRMIRQRYRDTLAIFTNYSSRMSNQYPPIVYPGAEAQDLRIFLKSGYNGQLKGEIESYLVQLDSAAQTLKPSK